MNITYYVASSIDGFIADSEGGVNWLNRVQVAGEDYGYAEFFASLDALLFGSKTYEQILTFGDWPYGDLPCWVLSSRELSPASSHIRVIPHDPRNVVQELNAKGCSEVWLVGGGKLAGVFHECGLITSYIVSVIPTVLGSGIPFLSGTDKLLELKLVSSIQYATGVVQNHYSRPESK
jgi:dihydrofolate reductase